MTLILCGFKSCGKTTIGKQLAMHLGFEFIDIDEVLIQRYFIESGRCVSIAELYEDVGEIQFRRLESDVIQQLEPSRETIIATGGGSFIDEDNREYLRKLGLVVYLSVDPLVIKKRIEETRIPAFMQHDFENTYFALFNERSPTYELVAHVTLETTHLSIDEILVKLTQLGVTHGS